jgi:hypothetical protein
MALRRMADSVTPTDIPVNDPETGRPWDFIAGYIDGVPRWASSAWDRFPNSRHVRIALNPATNDGDVLDVEKGAANPDQAPGWVMRRRAAGADPSVYCSLSLWPTVRDQFHFAGVPEPHWWIAAYPGIGESLYDGTVAHQFADPPYSGGHWDLSVVADHWPGIESGGSMDEQSIVRAFMAYTFDRQGKNGEGDPQTGTANVDAIFKNMDSGWTLPVRELKPLLETLLSMVRDLKTEVDSLKQSSATAGGTAHVKIEGDFPFTPSP